jgi:hypothetical protein
LARLDGDGVARLLRLEPSLGDIVRLGPSVLIRALRALMARPQRP